MISGDEIRDILVSDLSVEEKAKTLVRFAKLMLVVWTILQLY